MSDIKVHHEEFRRRSGADSEEYLINFFSQHGTGNLTSAKSDKNRFNARGLKIEKFSGVFWRFPGLLHRTARE